jgi:mono/diheme cytochrome c family protein
MRRSTSIASLASLSLLFLATACGGGEGGTPADTPQGGAPEAPAAAASFDPATITPEMLALGDSLFHGLIGATSCQACHGADGAQATVAPNLTDAEWLHSDGSWEGIFNTVKTGVMTPKQFTSVMPPWGGVPMTDDQTRAVSAYVYKLSHK